MKIESKIPEEQKVKEEKKQSHFILGLIIGMCVELIITGAIFFKAFPVIWWAIKHPNEMIWVIDRYDTIQKASHVLFFKDEMTGVTIVKPQMMK